MSKAVLPCCLSLWFTKSIKAYDMSHCEFGEIQIVKKIMQDLSSLLWWVTLDVCIALQSHPLFYFILSWRKNVSVFASPNEAQPLLIHMFACHKHTYSTQNHITHAHTQCTHTMHIIHLTVCTCVCEAGASRKPSWDYRVLTQSKQCATLSVAC